MNEQHNYFEEVLSQTKNSSPLLLFPIRLETHFKKDKQNKKQLCVRIFPDEINLNYNNEKLSSEEVADAKFFWLQWFIASGSDKREYEAWQKLCAKYSLQRASWIVRQLRPATIDKYRNDCELFYRRPYTVMGNVEVNCSKILHSLSQINLDESRRIHEETGEYEIEYSLRTHLVEIKKYLFEIECDVMFCDKIVDYLYDNIYHTIDFLRKRLETFGRFYERFHEFYINNLNAMELRDRDASILTSFTADVDAFFKKFQEKRITLTDLVDEYLKKSEKDNFFPSVAVDDSEDPKIPTLSMLPDVFFFIGEAVCKDNSKFQIQKSGLFVAKDLEISPIYNKLESADSIKITDSGDLDITNKYRWVVDYEEAEKVGMAITVPLKDNVVGFNYIYVVGVCKEDRKKELSSLFKSHIYNQGMKFIKPGTPTNLVENINVPQDDYEEDMRKHYDIEVLEAFNVDDLKNDTNDAVWTSSVLKLSYKDILGHCKDYDNKNEAITKFAYEKLWQYLKNQIKVASEEDFSKEMDAMLEDVGKFLKENVRASGILPSFRIGDKPYGILPTANFKNLNFNGKNDFEKNLYSLIVSLNKRWNDIREDNVISVDKLKGKDADKNYLIMAGQTPYSVKFNVRDLIYCPYMPIRYKTEHYPAENIYKNNRVTIKTGRKNYKLFDTLCCNNVFTPYPLEDLHGGLLSKNRNYKLHELTFEMLDNELVKALSEEYDKEGNNFLTQITDKDRKLIVSGFIDLFTYRVDAWITGFIYESSASSILPTIGSFGWVFNLKENSRKQIKNSSTVVKNMKLPEDSKNSLYEPNGIDKGEYILAPSMQHALTAAILRSAYLKTKRNSSDTHMCVNLSSMRVRQALRIIDGVQKGTSTSIILGNDFERFLHESYRNGPEMDKYIYPMRKLFPQYIELEAKDSRANDYVMQVVNGEILLNTFLDKWGNNESVREWLLKNCMSLEWYVELDKATSINKANGGKDKEALFYAIEKMADSYDALNDLLLAEGVHRMVMGDRESFYAIGKFMAEGKGTLPNPAVLHLPADYVVMSHKCGIALPIHKGASFGVMAKGEPNLNSWLSNVVGDLSDYTFYIETVDKKGNKNLNVCTLKEIGITPIEYIYLSMNDISFKRIIECCWRSYRRDFTTPVSVRFDFYDNAYDIYQLIHTSRSFTCDDFANNNQGELDKENYFDLVELKKRYEEVKDCFEKLYLNMKEETSDIEFIQVKQADTTELSMSLKKALSKDKLVHMYQLICSCSQSGMLGVLPEFNVEMFTDDMNPIAQRALIAERMKIQYTFVQKFIDVCTSLKERIDRAISIINDNAEYLPSERYIEAIQALIINNFKVFPIVQVGLFVKNHSTYTEVLKNGLNYYNNIDELSFEDWQSEVSEVCEGMKNLNKVDMFMEANDRSMNGKAILQIDTNNDISERQWLGVKVDNESRLKDVDSLVIYNADVIRPHTLAEMKTMVCSGMIIGSWNEYIPYRKSSAGVAMHVDIPDNEAPQSILLAFNKRIIQNRRFSLSSYFSNSNNNNKNSWQANEIADILDFTRLMVMNRAVEPDHIYKDDQLSYTLPLISNVNINRKVQNFDVLSQSISDDKSSLDNIPGWNNI